MAYHPVLFIAEFSILSTEYLTSSYGLHITLTGIVTIMYMMLLKQLSYRR